MMAIFEECAETIFYKELFKGSFEAMVLIFGAIIFSCIYMHYNDCVSSVVGKTFIIGRFYIKILFQGSHLA